MSFIYDAEDLQGTAALGAALADVLPAGSVVALHGTLGAGKTQLVQAVAEALGVARQGVTSPTFVLINEYAGRLPIYHFDAYRIPDDDEFLQLGPEEYFEGAGLCFVEWAERVSACLPPELLHVRIDVLGETARRFRFEAAGARYEDVVARLSTRLG